MKSQSRMQQLIREREQELANIESVLARLDADPLMLERVGFAWKARARTCARRARRQAAALRRQMDRQRRGTTETAVAKAFLELAAARLPDVVYNDIEQAARERVGLA